MYKIKTKETELKLNLALDRAIYFINIELEDNIYISKDLEWIDQSS